MNDEPLRALTAQDALHELRDYFLGEGFYIADPVSGTQANAIIVDTIKRKYTGYEFANKPLTEKIKEMLSW